MCGIYFIDSSAEQEIEGVLKKYGGGRNVERGLFLAGFSVGAGAEERFTILTTGANASMRPVHDRMPLILEEDEVIPWLLDGTLTAKFLTKTPCPLERETEYEQLSLF